LISAFLLVGCASQAQPIQHPIAVPRPLVQLPINLDQEATPPQLPGPVSAPTVVGTRGEGLNMATSVHRILIAMGIPSEVRCVERSMDRGQVQTRLEIRFPTSLSPTQRQDVDRVMRLFQPGVALQ